MPEGLLMRSPIGAMVAYSSHSSSFISSAGPFVGTSLCSQIGSLSSLNSRGRTSPLTSRLLAYWDS